MIPKLISLDEEEVIYLGYVLSQALEESTRPESLVIIASLLTKVTN